MALKIQTVEFDLELINEHSCRGLRNNRDHRAQVKLDNIGSLSRAVDNLNKGVEDTLESLNQKILLLNRSIVCIDNRGAVLVEGVLGYLNVDGSRDVVFLIEQFCLREKVLGGKQQFDELFAANILCVSNSEFLDTFIELLQSHPFELQRVLLREA